MWVRGRVCLLRLRYSLGWGRGTEGLGTEHEEGVVQVVVAVGVDQDGVRGYAPVRLLVLPQHLQPLRQLVEEEPGAGFAHCPPARHLPFQGGLYVRKIGV